MSQNNSTSQLVLKGTTTIGVVCKDGVILASDTRVTMGYYVAHKFGKKVYKIDDHMGMTIAGTVADAQRVVDILTANAHLYKINLGRPMPISSAARLVANLLFSARYVPLSTQVLVGGIDETGPHVYNLDPYGSLTEEKSVSTGSGSLVAYGILEDKYREGMTITELLPIIAKSVNAAMKRDVASGNNYNIIVIDQYGYKELSDEEKSGLSQSRKLRPVARTQEKRTQDKDKIEISQYILEKVPREAEVTRIEYEGPMLAVYTKKPEILVDQSSIVAEIVGVIRKRIVIRPDPSVRIPEVEAEKIARELIPPEAEITDINFDPSLGEIIIETKKPGLVIGRNGAVLQEIIKKTKWRPHVLRTPPIKSKIITHMRHYLHSESKERERILRTVGERIFRPKTFEVGDIRMTVLGGAQEVGRSAFLIKTRETSVLLDCGIHPGSNRPFESFPRFDCPEFELDSLDAVVISHAHLDHCGLTPFLFKYGYDGPVYCTAPTSNLMTMLQLDYLDVASKQGVTPFYDQKDVRECVLHTIPLRYGVVTDIAPDIRLTLHNSGHILGGAMVHLHIGEGLHNIVYTSDYKFGRTMLLEAAATEFPRIETVITESTYGGADDNVPSRVEAEEAFTRVVNQTLERKGKVLIPVPAVGRAQEIMLIINGYMKRGLMKEAPVFIEGMISEATAIHTAYPEYLGREVRHSILHEEVNPFQSDYFTIVEHPSIRQSIIDGEPCIVLATSGMLEGGPVIEYFKNWAHDDKNTIIFVSYQIEGTMGKRVQKGVGEVTMMDNEGKMAAISVKMQTESIGGFSGHSDRRQLVNYLTHLTPKPERIFVVHGEKQKTMNFANFLDTKAGINTVVPAILETYRLL